MNTTSLAKSMNGALSVTDGEITIEEGQITFSDGSVLSSIGDIALKSADNTFTGDNTFNNNITMVAEIPISIFHLTNKSYVDDAISQQRLSLLASNNTFTGINTISNTTPSSSSANGALIVKGGVGIAGNLNVGGALNVGGSLFSSYNAGGASITYPSTGYALNWNITGGGAETSLINVVPNTTYFDRGFNFHNVVQGVAFTGSSVPMFALNAITSTLRSNLNVSGIITANSSLSVGGDVSITGELTTNKSINNVRIKGATILGQQTIVIDTSANSISNLLTSGQENYVFGKSNLTAYTTGTQNVAIGLNNLQAITTQSFNTAIGCNVFKNTTSLFNVGIGEQVFSAHTGSLGYNIGIGYNSCINNITGTENIAIGYLSGNSSIGRNNTFLGSQTSTNSATTSYSYSTAVGTFAQITDSNQVVLGRPTATTYVSIPSTKASTSSTTGALVVVGGVGVGGDLNVGGMIKTNNSTDYKKIVLYDQDSNEAVGTAVNFYGLGIMGGTLRFQTPATSNFHSFYCNTTLNMQVGNGKVYIPSTTATTAYNEGALIVNGGIGVAGRVISNSEIQASSFYSPAGTLSVGGLAYLNNGVSLPAGKTIRWATGDIAVESYYADNDRYGLSYTSGITRLHTSDSYPPSGIRFSLATGLSTYTDLMTIAHNGDTKVASTTSGTVNLGTTPIAVNTTSASFTTAGDIGCVGNLISTGFLYSKYRIPLHDSGWFTVSNNTSYDSGSLAYLAYNETKYPYAIKISFRASGSSFPVYDITGMTFQAGNSDGYSFRWINATSYSVRTGTTTVAKYYDGANYINAASGQYRIHILP